MSKKSATPKVAKKTAAPDVAKEIPKDLQDQVSSARAIALCYNLLQQAPFPFGHSQAVDQSLKFLQTLHEQVLSQAKAHPDASLVPELAKA